MPFYEYKCQDCGFETEYFQTIHAEPKGDCPLCHGRLVKLVTKGAGLIFKGSGFYETDYKRKDTSPGKSNGHGHHKALATPADDRKGGSEGKTHETESAKGLATAEHTD